MSRAFVKDDAPGRVLVPARPPLPEHAENLVTPAGLAALEAEEAALRTEMDVLLADATGDAPQRLAVVREELAEVEARRACAVVVAPPDPPDDVVRVGATVTLVQDDGPLTVRITGVDEADPLEGRIAFTAPLAAAVLGLRVGDVATAEVGGAPRRVRIDAVTYAP